MVRSEISAETTDLLRRWEAGDAEALDSLIRQVQEDLRAVASRHLARARPGITYETSGLLQEAWCRLLKAPLPKLENRQAFFAFAATIIKNLLAERERRYGRAKHGAGWIRRSLDEDLAGADESPLDKIALKEALARLRKEDARAAEAFELRYFLGLTLREIARHSGVSISMADRASKRGRGWLFLYLTDETP